MNLPGRRERDERRKFKDLGSLQRMGEALGFHDNSVADAEVIVDDTPSNDTPYQGGGGPVPPKREPQRGPRLIWK
jgi:hypothetical protein